MQANSSSKRVPGRDSVPNAFDARIVGFVLAVAVLAASVNLPYGGPAVAVAAFAILTVSGILAHVHGERRLRRLTVGLVERWTDAGGRVESVTRSSAGLRTEWTVHTSAGPVTVGGLALTPLSQLSIEWQGTGDAVAASSAEDRIDRLAAEWYREIFQFE